LACDHTTVGLCGCCEVKEACLTLVHAQFYKLLKRVSNIWRWNLSSWEQIFHLKKNINHDYQLWYPTWYPIGLGGLVKCLIPTPLWRKKPMFVRFSSNGILNWSSKVVTLSTFERTHETYLQIGNTIWWREIFHMWMDGKSSLPHQLSYFLWIYEIVGIHKHGSWTTLMKKNFAFQTPDFWKNCTISSF